MQAVWELVVEFLIFGAFAALCGLMWCREDFRPVGLVVFALAILPTFVAFVIWADVSGYNEVTP